MSSPARDGRELARTLQPGDLLSPPVAMQSSCTDPTDEIGGLLSSVPNETTSPLKRSSVTTMFAGSFVKRRGHYQSPIVRLSTR